MLECFVGTNGISIFFNISTGTYRAGHNVLCVIGDYWRVSRTILTLVRVFSRLVSLVSISLSVISEAYVLYACS